MKDIIYERLIELSMAQESLIHTNDLMERLCRSQQNIEKYSYEAMNMTDTVLNLTKQGKQLASTLRDRSCDHSEDSCEDSKDSLIRLFDEMQDLLNNIIQSAVTDNEILHTIDYTAAELCVMTEELKAAITSVSSCVDHAVACAEMVMAKELCD